MRMLDGNQSSIGTARSESMRLVPITCMNVTRLTVPSISPSSRISAATASLTGQDLLKCEPKFQIENGVDDWIESRIGVAEPCEEFEDDGRDARLAECGNNVDAEERYPADEKHSHDDSKSNSSLFIFYIICLLNRILFNFIVYLHTLWSET